MRVCVYNDYYCSRCENVTRDAADYIYLNIYTSRCKFDFPYNATGENFKSNDSKPLNDRLVEN